MFCGRHILIIIMTALLAATLAGPAQAGEPAEWWAVQQALSRSLMEEKGDIFAQARASLAVKPTNDREAMRKLDLLMRCGLDREAVQALKELKQISPRLAGHQVSSIYYTACDDLGAWNLARSVAETYAGQVYDIELENRLLKHLLTSGWTVDKVDGWLAGMPTEENNFWLKQRLRFNVGRGRGDALVKKLSDKVRGKPADIEGAVALLEALNYARTGESKWDMSWMAGTIKPSSALQCRRLGSGLKDLGQWTASAAFYRQGIGLPLTDAEVRSLSAMYSVRMPDDKVRVGFAVQLREDLAACLLQAGQKAEAQKWMVEAADMRQEHDIPLNALFSGQVQAASGQRTIEGRILAEEKLSEGDPRYWQERARYYRGRQEPALEEEALLKGLALAGAQPAPEAGTTSRGMPDWRSALLSDYAFFLKREQRSDEAVKLLRREMAEAPVLSESSRRAAHMLAFDFQDRVKAEDDVLWKWLAGRPKWDYTEERLLWRMLESAERKSLTWQFKRAEEMAFENPSRSFTLGWIMNRMNFAVRSIPHLSFAVDKAADPELKERAVFTLFESYLDAADWKNAEKIFPEASRRLTTRELPEWHSRLAAVAAGAGAKGEAMRIWGRTANICPARLDNLKALAGAGLASQLKEFYEAMRKKAPESTVPARALALLTTGR